MTNISFVIGPTIITSILVCSACEIQIPDKVFHCEASRDCPSGWVCQDDRCRRHRTGSTEGPIKEDAGPDGGGDEPEDPCDEGFARDDGGDCKNIDDCHEGACNPGGRCVDGINDYSCTCDKGFEQAGPKACKPKSDCEPNPCGPFTSGCVDEEGPDTYSCMCSPGYRNTDPKTCGNVNECKERANACNLNPAYPCRDLEPFYTCEGQFLSKPMPDATIGAAKKAVYNVDRDTVFDTVTMLRWQRVLPATYPKCSGKTLNPELDSSCTWEEARTYCDELVLGGYTEWRLPSKIELESLLDLTQPSTALAPALPPLPATPPLGFWTSSAYSLGEENYWYVDFEQGWSYFGHKMWQPARVRCVLQ